MPFDGTDLDSFSHTSLHLSFTDWMVPVSLGSTGDRDAEAFFVESVISIHDNGKWVADVDIKRAIGQRCRWSRFCESDGVSNHCSIRDVAATSSKLKFTAVDCWEELLDHPNDHMVSRASGNWIGRLALTAMSVRMGFTVVVLPRDCCPGCLGGLAFGEYPAVDEFGNTSSLLMVIM